MRELGKIATALFDKIRSRFENVRLGDDKAKSTTDPALARFFNFDYVDSNGKNYGNVTMSIVDGDSLKIYFSKNISDMLEGVAQQEWFQFLRGLREFSRRNLLKFDTRDITKSSLSIQDLKQQSKSDTMFDKTEVNIGESRMWGTSRSSYQECGPAKIIVRHSSNVDEEKRGARTRNIEAVFIESHNGERRLLPFKNLHGARAMARHCSNGGETDDDVGESISGMVQEMSAMTHFVREAKRRQFEDQETGRMANSAVKRYQTLKSQLRNLSGNRGYRAYVESFSPGQDTHDDIDVDALRERFVRKMYDDRFNDALPYVYRAYQEDLKNPPMVNEFEEWADGITEDAFETDDEKLRELNSIMSAPLKVGQDGIDAIEALRTVLDDEGLAEELTQLARLEGSDSDARPTVLTWMRENGMGFAADQVEHSIDNGSGEDSESESEPTPPTTTEPGPQEPTAPTESTNPLDFMRQLSRLMR